jgi:hypothetical protein
VDEDWCKQGYSILYEVNKKNEDPPLYMLSLRREESSSNGKVLISLNKLFPGTGAGFSGLSNPINNAFMYVERCLNIRFTIFIHVWKMSG